MEGPQVASLEAVPVVALTTFIAGPSSCFLHTVRFIGLTFMLLLELNEELGVELNLVVYVLLSPAMLLPPKGRGVLQIDSAVLTVKVRHYYLYYNSNNN